MPKRITGICLMLMLLLAPLSGVLASVCYCEDISVQGQEIAPLSCCEQAASCCYGQHEKSEAVPLFADVKQPSRGDFKAPICQSVRLFRAFAPVATRDRSYLDRGDTPSVHRRELSLRQSWLI